MMIEFSDWLASTGKRVDDLLFNQKSEALYLAAFETIPNQLEIWFLVVTAPSEVPRFAIHVNGLDKERKPTVLFGDEFPYMPSVVEDYGSAKINIEIKPAFSGYINVELSVEGSKERLDMISCSIEIPWKL